MAQLSVKVYYVENKATKEIRKFAIDGEVAENFEYLVSKIRQVFPDLLRKDLEIFWKDEEDDYISVSTDEELKQALHSIPQSNETLKIYVKVKKERNEKDEVEHVGVTCDGCDSKINGIRYQCTVCYDFDLCSSCQSKGEHPDDHEMLCIKKPRSSGTFYVMRSPFGRGCQRGRGPWSGMRRGGPWPGMRRGGPWPGMRRGCHGGKPGSCKKNCDSKSEPNSKSQEEATQENVDHPFNTMIQQLSASFGLDPDVVESQIQSFTGNCSNEGEGCGEMVAHLAQTFGLNEEQFKQIAKMFSPQPSGKEEKEEKKTTDDEEITILKDQPNEELKSDEKMQTDSSETEDNTAKKSEQQTVNYEHMVNEFAKQFGFNREQQQGETSPFNGLGEVMGKIFESFAAPVPNPNDSEQNSSESQKTKSEKKDDFVVVDGTPVPESLTREEKYEQRLEKAIKQMEAMGFDNDGGWLRQLLISKDLSIGKVLDALNPSM